MRSDTGDTNRREATSTRADSGSITSASAINDAAAGMNPSGNSPEDDTASTEDLGTEGLGTVDEPLIYDHAPHRIRDKADLLRLVGAAILGVLVTLITVYLTGLTTGMQSDMERYAQSISWLITMPFSFLSQLCTVIIIGWGVIQTLAGREWTQCLSAAVA